MEESVPPCLMPYSLASIFVLWVVLLLLFALSALSIILCKEKNSGHPNLTTHVIAFDADKGDKKRKTRKYAITAKSSSSHGQPGAPPDIKTCSAFWGILIEIPLPATSSTCHSINQATYLPTFSN